MPLLAVVLGGLAGGCNTYHYYDIDVKFTSPVTSSQASVMKLCQVEVSGAASDTVDLELSAGEFSRHGHVRVRDLRGFGIDHLHVQRLL